LRDYPDRQQQPPPQGKLVLPAYPGEEQHTDSGAHKALTRPQQPIQHKTPFAPQYSLARLVYFWHKDLAYKVLLVATSLIIVVGGLFLLLVSSALIQNSNLFAQNDTPQNLSTGIVPSGTVNFRPTFPTPSGGQGSDQSSQPSAQNTPSLEPTQSGDTTPTVQPGTTPVPGGTLTVQISSDVPPEVTNGSKVMVGVITSEPNVTVMLVVSYNVPPYRYYGGQHTTDDDGNGTLPWRVQVAGFEHATAVVVVSAVDQNGQQVYSTPVTVQVV
jgi:hypothetical protein